jgi:hypothetical protein
MGVAHRKRPRNPFTFQIDQRLQLEGYQKLVFHDKRAAPAGSPLLSRHSRLPPNPGTVRPVGCNSGTFTTLAEATKSKHTGMSFGASLRSSLSSADAVSISRDARSNSILFSAPSAACSASIDRRRACRRSSGGVIMLRLAIPARLSRSLWPLSWRAVHRLLQSAIQFQILARSRAAAACALK